MTLRYESSNGKIFDLMRSPIFAQNPEAMAGTEWKYTASAGPGVKPRISKIYRAAREHALTLEIFAENKDEFNAIMNELHEAFEADVRLAKPGKIWWNDYYKLVYIIATEHTEFEELFECTEETVTVVAVSQYWISPVTARYRVSNEEETELWLDYAFDYEFDYKKSRSAVELRNDSMFEADFSLTFYGPCQNPLVTIGGEPYSLTISLLAGERAVIDSAAQTIRKISAKGVEENAFRSWTDKTHYIFRKMQPGQIAVTWLMLFDFDLTLYRERNTPIWI